MLASPDYRRFWVAQMLSALANGSLRFTFVWLVLRLSDWEPVAGAIGVALGLPALLVSIPAGAVADRVDRRLLVVRLTIGAALVLALTSALVWTDVMTVPLAAACAASVGALLASVSPTFQAMVPLLVRPERLMTGVALQGIGQNFGMLFGAVVAGVAIAVAGVGGAFFTLGALQVLAALQMARVRLPERARAPRERNLRAEMGDGLRFVFGHEPVRSLVVISIVLGLMIGVVTVLLPGIAEDELGQGALGASMLFALIGVGMMTTSLWLARAGRLAHRGTWMATAFTIGAGGCVVVMGLSDSYVVTLVDMLVWGVGGGIVMTIQRTLLQEHTPDELMGRVMGVNSLAMLGSFPVAAVLAGVGAAALGPQGTLVAAGGLTVLAALLTAWRPAVRTA